MIERFRETWCNWIDRLSEVAASSSYAYSVWHFSLLNIIWGVWLLFPNDTFASAPIWEGMENLASEVAWGILGVILGVSKIHSLFQKHTVSLSIFSLMSGYYWLAAGISFMLAGPRSPGGMALVLLGLYEFWVYKRLSTRKKE